jgi:uncharacterized protein
VILLNTDAWVALIDRAHVRHAASVRAFKDLEGPLVTVWPVVSDVLAELADTPRGQDIVWEMMARGAIQLRALDESDAASLRDLMKKNAEQRMTFTDAAVLHVARREGIRTVFTVAGGRLAGYRAVGGRRLKFIP